MKTAIYTVLGLLLTAAIIYKISICATCTDRLFGFEVSGYAYIAVNTILATILLSGAYSEYQKSKKMIS